MNRYPGSEHTPFDPSSQRGEITSARLQPGAARQCDPGGLASKIESILDFAVIRNFLFAGIFVYNNERTRVIWRASPLTGQDRGVGEIPQALDPCKGRGNCE